MIQTVRAQSPLKGVNRAFARESQPDGTCWDALNVLPQDRYGRMRVAQRSGIGQLDELDSDNYVKLLHVASTINPSVGVGTLTSDSFTYANGNLATVSASAWTTYTDFSSGTTTTSAAQSLVVSSNKVVASAALIGLAKLTVDPSLSPSFYSVQAEVTLTNWANTNRVGIACRYNAGATAGFIVWLNNAGGTTRLQMITQAGVVVVPDVGSTPNVIVTVSAGSTYTIKIEWVGNVYTAYLDGVATFTGTVAANSANLGVGIVSNNNADPSIDNFVITGANAPTGAINRTTLKLVGTAGTNTYVGDPTAMSIATASSTYPINATANFVSAATLFGYTYIVDGNGEPKRLNLGNSTMVAFTETAGDAPDGCNIACNWRGRLVLSGQTTDPQNVYASRAGDPLDWDYSQTDPAAAFVLNTAASGKVGQPVQALIPISDDILIIGLEQSMYAVRGDPADGGSVDQVTDFAGISSSTAWTRGPDGAIYFVGARGFFKMNPMATEVTEISQSTYPQFFQGINRSTNYINLIYDADRYGIWIFVTPTAQSATTHIFYDFRFEGYWPQRISETDAGPISAIYWDGYDSDTRYPVLGGYDGFLYAFNLTNRTDNGSTITAYATLGPFHPAQGESMLVGLTANFGELTAVDTIASQDRWQTSFTLHAGTSAYDVTEGVPAIFGTVSWGRDGRTKTIRQRLRGEWFTVKLSNAAASNYFSMESVELEFDQAGKNRRQR